MYRTENRLEVGSVGLTFHRTVRVPRAEGWVNDLPAGLGEFPVYKVSDFKSSAPEGWKEKGHFIPMYPQEAMWIGFSRPKTPVAILVGAGMVNAVTGRRLEARLEQNPQNYLAVPPQPWLDGFKRIEGKSVYQFVAAQLGLGETAEEQILGTSEFGGLQIGVYNPRINLILATRPREFVVGGEYLKCAVRTRGAVRSFSPAREMGLGAGGAISQKIYPDPYLAGRKVEEVWSGEPIDKAYVYIVHSGDFRQITGKNPPETPITYKFYQLHGYPWFGLPDGTWGDVQGGEVFEKIKPVSGNPDPVNDTGNQQGSNPSTQSLW